MSKGREQNISHRIEREQRNMETWGRTNGISTDEIEMRKKNIVEKYRGWRDGWMV